MHLHLLGYIWFLQVNSLEGIFDFWYFSDEKSVSTSCTSHTPPSLTTVDAINTSCSMTQSGVLPPPPLLNPNPSYTELPNPCSITNGACATDSYAAYAPPSDNQYSYGPSCYFRSSGRPTPYSREVAYMRDPTAARYCSNGLTAGYMGRAAGHTQFGYDPTATMMGGIADPRRNYAQPMVWVDSGNSCLIEMS